MKKVNKKIGSLVILLLLVVVPKNVLAEEFVKFDDFTLNEETKNIEAYTTNHGYGEFAQIWVGDTGKFTFKIYGNDFDSTKKYVVELTSDFLNEKKSYLGSEFLEGKLITINDAKSNVNVKVHEENSDNIIPYKMQNDCTGVQGECDSSIHMLYTYELYFNDERDYTELDEIFKKISKNGEVEIDCVDVSDSEFVETLLTAALRKKYASEDFWIYGSYHDVGKPYLNISKGDKSKDYDVKYIYKKANPAAMKKVSDVGKKMNYTWQQITSDYNKRFVVEDLESINYLYNTRNIEDNELYLSSIVNYSSKIHELADNANIDFIFDVRAGGTDSNFYEMNLGPIDILYDGVVYDYVNPIGYALTRIIYVPDDTEKTREAFINAAKKRINEYLKGVKVDITYGGKLSDLDEADYSWDKYDADTQTSTYVPLFDFDKTNGEWYKVKIEDREYSYFIVKGTEKMNVPYVKTVDVNTNVYVTTDAFDAPLDSKIFANLLDENSEEYKILSKKINLIKGLIYNINMYSTSLETYISKLASGNFKVYIPISNDIEKKNLVAVYIKDDGTIEKHTVTISNGYASFETNHFSTYALIEDSEVVDKVNPKTGDNIIMYIIMLGISLISAYLLIRKYKKYN